MNRKFIGSFTTDVAMVVVGDPCRLLDVTRDDAGDSQYGRFVDDVDDTNPTRTSAAFGNSIVARTGADGWIHVYVERDNGKPVRLIVDLTPWCEPTPQESDVRVVGYCCNCGAAIHEDDEDLTDWLNSKMCGGCDPHEEPTKIETRRSAAQGEEP